MWTVVPLSGPVQARHFMTIRILDQFLRKVFVHLLFTASLAYAQQLDTSQEGQVMTQDSESVDLCQQARVWNSKDRAPFTADAVSALGNGNVCVFSQGPDIAHFYGPPYSSPDLLQLLTDVTPKGAASGVLTDSARRERGTAIWHHWMQLNGQPAMEFTEYVAATVPIYVREFICSQTGIQWNLLPHPSGHFEPSSSVPGAWHQILPPGERFLHYPSNLGSCCWIVHSGTCRAVEADNGHLEIHLEPGRGSLAIISEPDYPAGIALVERVRNEVTDQLIGPTREWWKAFTARRLAVCPELRSLPEPDAEALDSVAVMIKAEYSNTGGALIGALLPMAYIRDLYGAARGMLTLGMHDEARDLLLFRFRKFQTFGNLQTAESMGTDCARHVHENDEVEGPAYIILETRDYLRASGDETVGRQIWPMLEWCFQVQLKHLAGGMLPFNGDETYIAGGFFPRSGLLQGSADTTLAFVTSGNWLVDWAVRNGFWSFTLAQRYRAILEEAHNTYRVHFFAGDRIWANEPSRESLITPPRFRHGVCEAGTPGYFGWVERNQSGRYISPLASSCDLPEEHPARTEIHSVSLLPVYLGAEILSPNEIRRVVDHVLEAKDPITGFIPTIPGGKGFVGYDPGLLLLNLLSLKDGRAQAAYSRLMKTLDAVQYWNEYYNQDGTSGFCIRANMWSCGINAEAAVKYLTEAHQEVTGDQ
jgi:hypothetical protein